MQIYRATMELSFRSSKEHQRLPPVRVRIAMEHAVTVRSFPADLEFPADLKTKIRFDPANKQLIYRGFMCKTEYDRLLRLSQHFEYQQAIVQLFQSSTVADTPKMRQFARVLLGMTAGCLVLAVVIWWLILTDSGRQNVSQRVSSPGSSSIVGPTSSAEPLPAGGWLGGVISGEDR